MSLHSDTNDWQTVIAPQLQSSCGASRLTLYDVPLRFSPSTRIVDWQGVDEDFPLFFQEELVRQIEEQTTFYTQRGFFKKSLHCGNCKAEMQFPQMNFDEPTCQIPLAITYKATTFRGEIELDYYPCHACGIPNVSALEIIMQIPELIYEICEVTPETIER